MDPNRTPPPAASTRAITGTISGGGGGGSGKIILGKYQLSRLLGRGSFGKVYHAQSVDGHKTVAVKVIEKPPFKFDAMESQIIREVSAMRRLKHHPNILKLHEVMATKTKIYLVMELARGGELFAKLSRKGRFSESTARRYFQQLISALRFCHQNGIAHRDLKPQNLLIDESGNLKVSDFGLSALPEQQRNGLLQTTCGTPAYLAPEVASRKGYDGSKADAWSCGVILFFFLAGTLPFDDGNLRKMYRMMSKREFQFPYWISKPARNIIYRLLDPNPNSRMGLDELMNNRWFKKSLKSDSNRGFGYDFGDQIADVECKSMNAVNAFDIISLSSGLNLSGLFEVGLNKVKRFTAVAKVVEIEEKLVGIGGEMGYRVERENKGRRIGLVKGRIVLVVEFMEAAPELLLGEVRVVHGGVGDEEFRWEELENGLKDVVVSWHDGRD